jgi:2-polyprenyl-6-methoxyphenol hydroxylase-like FAD-dependent oxidoreductase
MSTKDVLIVGAGPTGLVLALWLQRQGISFRIVDQGSSPAQNSRALVVHARILELYRQLDLADELLSHGYKLPATNVWVNGQHCARIPLGEFGTGMTPYPFLLVIPQDKHEEILEKRLNSLGIFVERRKKLEKFSDDGSGIYATLVSEDDGTESTCESAYIAGCDGAHSAVRHTIGAKYEGETYAPFFYIADVEAEEQDSPFYNGEAHLTFADNSFNLIIPLAQERRIRLVGTTIPKGSDQPIDDSHPPPELTLESVLPNIKKTSGIDIKNTNWFSAYRCHHRVAEKFREGRAFLVGDAAHIHSPVGGQGMNTGIMDAINLAWKLASVIKQPSMPEESRNKLLDSYQSERRSFALSVVGATDHGFTVLTSPGFFSHMLRTWIIPYLAPIITRFQSTRSEIFRRGSQLVCSYRDSPINQSYNNGGTIQPGDRLPWAETETSDNFSTLSGISWQVQVYGEGSQDLAKWCRNRNVELAVFKWESRHEQVGLKKDVAYLLRPDHYVAGVFDRDIESEIDEYFSSRCLQLLGPR